MSTSLRLSEKWFHRGLWLVSFLFAWFLIGLGNALVGDLPKVESTRSLDDFLDAQQVAVLTAELKSTQQSMTDALAAQEQAQLKLRTAQLNHRSARESFASWVATRRVTGLAAQDETVIQRTKELDKLGLLEREASAAVERQQQVLLDARQAEQRAQVQMGKLRETAHEQFQAAHRAQELRIFAYRLALTLPLLALAGWLFVKRRQGPSWPFVWGFVYFALFTFFVELVPYLPNYGGYVRYTVGIVLTVLGGRYAIAALQRYLEKQKEVEALPDTKRRSEMNYDLALTRLGKSVCPGCERSVDVNDNKTDFCPHCGLCLFDCCGQCKARKSAFARYCFACGCSSQGSRSDTDATSTGPSASTI